MAAEKPTEAASTPSESAAPAATPKKADARKGRTASAKPKAEPEAPKAKERAPRAPRRPTLPPERLRLLRTRDSADDRRPLFTRQQSYRYARIGRDESWRRPRGLQSKQRRHYSYRSTVVSVGFRSPRKVRGLTPSGFRPVLVQTIDEIARVDAKGEAAVIARTVGTRRRLVLEEKARQLGIHVLNPITPPEEEEET